MRHGPALPARRDRLTAIQIARGELYVAAAGCERAGGFGGERSGYLIAHA